MCTNSNQADLFPWCCETKEISKWSHKYFWKLTKCILLSSSLFYFNWKESSPKHSNPAWISQSVPPVILTLGTAVLWKSACSHCLGAMGKSYLGPIRNVPRLCPAVVLPSEELVSRSTAEGQATAFPWKSWGKEGDKWPRLCCSFASEKLEGSWRYLGCFSRLLGDVLERWKV